MEKRYEVFCLADDHFYETPNRLFGAADGKPQLYEPANRPAPDGWRRHRSGDWLHLSPTKGQTPAQGWKIHVSACLDNAEKAARVVWDYCVSRTIPFKFVPGPNHLFLRNSKYAGRGTSGKFATLYPSNEEQLHRVLGELGELLDGEPGPYILTDLRWRQGPLYVRYGGFTQRFCTDADGTLVPAVEDGSGRLVPDRRDPVFHVPEWVVLPDFLEPELTARNATTTSGLPYRIEQALHFSNGGGVYAGHDLRTGEKVVLKEARPHAGLAADGADAVTRLERERAVLERLSGSGVAPEVRDWFVLDDHRFLVMEYLEGSTLNTYFGRRHPLLVADPDPGVLADYTAWALRVQRSVEDALAVVHDRGVVFNDLHLFNILLGPDEESVRLIDFEAAAHIDEDRRQVVAHPGFLAPADRRGFAIDRYALACLRLALFLPLTTLLGVDRGKAAHLADAAAAEFPVPRAFLAEAVDEITGTPQSHRGGTPQARRRRTERHLPVDPGDWPRSRDSMYRALTASATPERDDRLFPGDIEQFKDGGGTSLAHGAAGVLYALAETGCPRHEPAEEWLLRHTSAPGPGTPLGLFDGLLGTAWVLARLGHTRPALELTERVLGERWQRLGPDLYGGLAGVALALDELSRTTGETVLHDRALEAVQLLADRAEHLPAGPDPLRAPPGGANGAGRGERARRPDKAGLLYGSSGSALCFLRLHERTGAPALLELAARHLRADLAHCAMDRSGALAVDEGRRSMPYLGRGSVGIALVLDDYLTHHDDEDFARARTAILPAATSRFYAQSGLFGGRAGMVLHLARTTTPEVAPRHLADQVARLSWHAVPYREQLAFAGDQVMRLSMDLATGTAGCLLAIGAALDERPAAFPFLPPLRRPQSRSPQQGAETEDPPARAESVRTSPAHATDGDSAGRRLGGMRTEAAPSRKDAP
ncbi:class III lanthionine synthetase LanKC [Streptomyces flaveus]|uniref:non-specific serine/threonine protein kinase n=1 Tax=Streptomyces flaveus TaxID=66370 RepID=A0A917VPV3_9ACTN|nr:class III lanthionine synthetase LanKC [Streptomyces flaveus]GGL02213.1 serine/threonine protein kinase [Streptomyces flaveus]